ncbi:MAG: IS30 family transposase [bacterium]|nr:IS30 family transposase [Gammaproteobacteria bacterium]
MARLGRPGLSDDEKAEAWRRWHEGESLSDIGRVLEKHPASIFGVLRLFGGYQPTQRVRRASSLSSLEREAISRGLASDHSMRQIAAELNRSPSTISREVNKNGGVARYRAATADARAWERARRPKLCALALNGRLRFIVAAKLSQEWSPEQISGWLSVTYPDNESLRVSHETIYKSLFVQSRGVLKRELQAHLRTQRVFRQSRTNNTRGNARGGIIDAISIADRPPEIEDRAVPGHWEGDLISGSGNTHIATLVERQSRFTMLVKVAGKDTNSVVSALTRHVKKLPRHLRESLTWDRCMELADHKTFTMATETKVYFCDPQSPWQRGTNENTNRLLRQYFPKKTNLAVHTQAELNKVAKRLNQRPRKTLGYRTPGDTLNDTVALTA